MDGWRGFAGHAWRDTIDVGGFIHDNVTPYTGNSDFLAGPTARTGKIWRQLERMFVEERRRGIYDVDPHTPSTITSHAPGYLDRDHELIVGLQTSAPLRRAIMPNGGLRMVQAGLAAYGYSLDSTVRTIFSQYRKTHNDGVFDAYPADVKAARRAHIITGLPDAYGRGRIIGDYRRVALYGVDRLIAERQAVKAGLDEHLSSADVVRDREELAEQIRALEDLRFMADRYGHDISGPATTGREAIQWLYFAYLGATKEQNGAAMSLGRTASFVDVFLQRDLDEGTLTEE
ncbi:MAG: pyruvate formate lyase family protein, partial [Actinoplanes sp.]